MLDQILKNAIEVFPDIITSYHTDTGSFTVPTAQQQAKIEQGIASLDAVGTGFMVVSGTSFCVSCVTFGLPYLGPVLGAAFAVIGIASSVIGFDINQSASHLQPFAMKTTGQKEAQRFHLTEDDQRKGKQKFKKLLFDEVTRHTFISRVIYDLAIIKKTL